MHDSAIARRYQSAPMPDDLQEAAVTAISVATENGTFLLLAAQDPRKRIDQGGWYYGTPAINAQGEVCGLPLRPGCVGGKLKRGETPEQAALREIAEEAGEAIASKIKESGSLTHVYTAVHARESDPMTAHFFHAHLRMPYAELAQCMRRGKEGAARPEDDVVALIAVKPEQIQRADNRYIVKGSPALVFWRDFVPLAINAQDSEAKRTALAMYNERGGNEPWIGIDREIIHREMDEYVAPGGTPGTQLSAEEISAKRGATHPANGALYEQIVKGRISALEAGATNITRMPAPSTAALADCCHEGRIDKKMITTTPLL